MESRGERKTARFKPAGEQQGRPAGRPARANQPLRPNPQPAAHGFGPAGKPERAPLLETPPSPLTLQLMRQGRAAQPADRRPSAGHSTHFQPATTSGHHRATGSSYQSQAAHLSAQRELQALAAVGKRSSSGGQASKRSSAPAAGAAHRTPRAPALLSRSEQQEWEQQAPSTNIHSLEVIDHEARMAISIYDPLPGQQQPQRAQSKQQQPPHRPDQPARPGADVAVRPSELTIIEETNASPDFQFDLPTRPRRPRCKGRGRPASERVLKSPTIPEEEDEQDGPLESCAGRGLPSSPAPDEHEPASESFMVATIADELGEHSRSLVIYSDRSLNDLTKDVLKRLVEIELDRRRGELACRPTASVDSDGEASPSESADRDRRMPELEVEAEKLAKLFKSHLEGARSPTSPCSLARPRLDPTTMNPDERARFVGRPNCGPAAGGELAGGACDGPAGCAPMADSQAAGSEQRDIYDFRCSCCCLHLIDQQRRADGERWCCCGCS